MRLILGGDSKRVAMLLVLISLGVYFPNNGARAQNNLKTASKVSPDLSQRGRARQRGGRDVYQKIHSKGYLLNDGAVETESNQPANPERMSIHVSVGPNILTRAGACPGCAYFLEINMLLAEGIMIGDGIMLSSGIMIGDILLQAQSAMTSEDATTFMR